MKRSMSFVGCGLLVLALSSFGVGCKSSKSGNAGDAGTDSGTGSGGSGAAGKGSGGSSGKGGAGGGGATLTTQQCTDMTVALGGGMMVPAACAMCGCTKNVTAATACLKDAMCWPLIGCNQRMCKGDTTCTITMCSSFLTGATNAMALGATLQSMCAAECGPAAGGTDAGTDAGH